jgi:ATP-binding cassette subfamily B protein
MRETLRGIRLVLTSSFRCAPVLATFGLTIEPIAAVLTTFNALFLKWLVDGVATSDPAVVRRSALLLAAATTVSMALRMFGWRLRTKLLERVGSYLDARVLELSSQLPGLEHHERAEYHDRLQMIHGSALGNALFGIIPGGAEVLRIVGMAILLGTIHPLLALLPLFGLPSVAAGVKTSGIEEASRRETTSNWRRSNALYRLVIKASSAKELRVFGLDAEIRRRHQLERDRWAEVYGRASIRSATWQTLGWTAFAAGYVGALALVAVRAANGQASLGDVMLAVTVAGQINGAVSLVAEEVRSITDHVRGAKHFVWLEDLVREHRRTADQAPPERLTDGIRFEDVSFTYPGTEAVVLAGVNLHLPAGARIAIVGDNGAGKTTLVKLICGFYAPTSGTITVDGRELGRLDLEAWRERVASGFQDYCRFELVAQETVGIGDLPRIDLEPAVVTALDRAGADEVPARLKDGLATQLGRSFDQGTELSMGQWQKLALGRAMMRDRPLVLILDEPTSSLDAYTERALFDRYVAVAEERRADGAITILVSHRFSTVRNADLIVVVDDGRIAEVGSHAELIERNGLYAELFGLQAAGYR